MFLTMLLLLIFFCFLAGNVNICDCCFVVAYFVCNVVGNFVDNVTVTVAVVVNVGVGNVVVFVDF